MSSGVKSASRRSRTRVLIASALLAALAACGGGGGGGGGGGSTAPVGGGGPDPVVPDPGSGGSPESWQIGPENDFYPPALVEIYTLENNTGEELPWYLQLTASWLHRTGPASGTLQPGEHVNVQIDVDPNGADPEDDAQILFKHQETNEVLADFDVQVEPYFESDKALMIGGFNGWTGLSPSPDSTVVYVSSSGGNDAWDGLSPTSPKRTIAAGKALLGHLQPDWLLLKRGDVWNESLGQWTKSGRSQDEPMVVAWYGTAAARPKLLTGIDDGVNTSGGGGSPAVIENVAFVGLHFFAHTYDGTTNCVGARILQPGKHLLLEDCCFQGYHTNLVLQGYGGTHEDLRVRRCVVIDAWAQHGYPTGHPQGLYVYAVNGLLIEENVFDHNGWSETVGNSGPDIFRHNLSIANGNSGVIVRGNIIANGSSHGMQLRCGGTVTNNLFVRNPIALSLGGGTDPEPSGVWADVRGNVILEGKDIDASNPRGWGMWFGNISSGQARYNIVANNSAGNQPDAVLIVGEGGSMTGVHNLSLDNNVFYNWGGNVRVEGEGWQITNLDMGMCDIQDLTHTSPLLEHTSTSSVAGIDSTQNRFFSKLVPASGWSQVQGVSHTIDYWMSQVGDTSSQDVLVQYANPTASVASYNALIGGPASLSAFLSQARSVSFMNWHPEWLAVCVNRYVRASFKSF